MTTSSSIKRTMPIDFDNIGSTKRIKVDYVDDTEKIDDTELMTSKKGKVQLDKNSSKTKDEKETPTSMKDSSGRRIQALSAVVVEMMVFLTGKSSTERSRYAKAIKFPSKLYYVMECGKFNDIISWTRSGTAFTVLDLPAFTTKVLSLIFGGGSKFASFHRKLNRWSFVKVPGEKETYSHPLFRRGQYVECQKITSSGVKGSDVNTYFEDSPPSSLLSAAVGGQPMKYIDSLLFSNSRLHGSATRKEEDSFGQFLRKHSEDSSSQGIKGVVSGGMDNAFFLPGLEYMRAPGMLHTRVDDCSGQSVSAAGFLATASLAHNETCFQDVQAREQVRINNAMIMARSAAGFDSFAAFQQQSIGSSNPASSSRGYLSNTSTITNQAVLDQGRFQTRPALGIHTNNARMQQPSSLGSSNPTSSSSRYLSNTTSTNQAVLDQGSFQTRPALGIQTNNGRMQQPSYLGSSNPTSSSSRYLSNTTSTNQAVLDQGSFQTRPALGIHTNNGRMQQPSSHYYLAGAHQEHQQLMILQQQQQIRHMQMQMQTMSTMNQKDGLGQIALQQDPGMPSEQV